MRLDLARFASCAVAVAALFAVAGAHADVSISFGTEEPVYEQPAPVYQGPPPGYYQPAPGYYQPAPGYYQPAPPPVYYPPPQAYYPPGPPPPYYAPRPGYPPPGYQNRSQGPKLSDMQQRALDNCALLAPRDQPRCRATVMSTAR